MDFCPCTHNPHDLTQELKQSGENKSRVERIKAWWGEKKQSGEKESRVYGDNKSRVERMKAGWGE